MRLGMNLKTPMHSMHNSALVLCKSFVVIKKSSYKFFFHKNIFFY